MPVEDFQNVVPLEKQAGAHLVQVDTADTAPPADAAEQGLTQVENKQPRPAPIASPAQTPPVKPTEPPSAEAHATTAGTDPTPQ